MVLIYSKDVKLLLDFLQNVLKNAKEENMVKAGFLPGIFIRGKSIVMQISFVMLIFLLFSDQISGWEVSKGRELPHGGASCPPPRWKKVRMKRH